MSTERRERRLPTSLRRQLNTATIQRERLGNELPGIFPRPLLGQSSIPDLLHHVETVVPGLVKDVIDNSDKAKDTTLASLLVGIIDYLPSDSPHLKTTWQILERSLDVDRAFNKGKCESAVIAFFIASGLLASTQRPFKERANKLQTGAMLYSRHDTLLLFDTAMPKEQDQDAQPLLIRVREALHRFKDAYEKIVKVPAQDEKEILRNLILINPFLPQEPSDIYFYFAHHLGDKGLNWVKQIASEGTRKTVEGNEQIAAELLFQGKLDGMADFIRSFICLTIVGTGLPQEQAVRYFLEHPEIPKVFWDNFANYTKTWREPFTNNLFLQDQETLDKILHTIPEKNFNSQEPEKKEFILRFIGAVAILKGNSPGHSNISYLSEYVRRMSEGRKDDDLTDLFDVLDDKIPGFIYLDAKSLIKYKIPKKHQNVDIFLKEVELILRNSQGPIYFSQAKVLVVEQKEKPAPAIQNGHRKEEIIPKKHPLDSLIGEIDSIPLWGEVMISKPEDASLIWDLLNQKFTQIHRDLTSERAMHTLTEESERETHGNSHEPFVIIPELLPSLNPLRNLKDLGVIAIEQKESQVSITIDGRIINDNEKSLRLMLNTQLDGANDSIFAVLLKAAALLGRRSFTEQTLLGGEISDIRSRLKPWNKKAKTEHLPQVTYNEDPRKRITGMRVLTFVGKKPVILTIHQ